MTEHPELTAIDIDVPADTPVESKGTAYYRLDDGLFKFLHKCEEENKILGFKWDGTRNIGVILVEKKQ